jgi:hypothetical protein
MYSFIHQYSSHSWVLAWTSMFILAAQMFWEGTRLLYLHLSFKTPTSRTLKPSYFRSRDWQLVTTQGNLCPSQTTRYYLFIQWRVLSTNELERIWQWSWCNLWYNNSYINILHKNYTYVIRKRNLKTSLLLQKMFHYMFRPLRGTFRWYFWRFLTLLQYIHHLYKCEAIYCLCRSKVRNLQKYHLKMARRGRNM